MPGQAEVDRIAVIASYFNPERYRSRRDRYRAFRQALRAPLWTVELGFGGAFDLGENDATVLLRLRSGDAMWQKERLLNLALARVPDRFRYIVWLDCDVVFERADWLEATVDALRRHVLVQPFSVVHDLGPNGSGEPVFTRPSMTSLHRDGNLDLSVISTNAMSQYSPGHAWAARREALGAGFYDAMILGSGDAGMALAAFGKWAELARAFFMNDRQTEHYRLWAETWHASVGGRIGGVDGVLNHLWHGDLANRGYDTRYQEFAGFDFDPLADIRAAPSGCWLWASEKPAMHDYVSGYFASRKEDG